MVSKYCNFNLNLIKIYIKESVTVTDIIKHPILNKKFSNTYIDILCYFSVNTKHALPTPTITSVFSGSDHLQVSWKPPPPNFLHVVMGYVLGYGTKEPNEKQEFISVSQRSFKIEKLGKGYIQREK